MTARVTRTPRRPTPPPPAPVAAATGVSRRVVVGTVIGVVIAVGIGGGIAWYRGDRAVARVIARLRPLADEVPADQVERRAAIEVTDRLLQDFPTAPEALYARGRILLRHGFQEEAATSLEAAIALVPDLAAAHELLGLDALQRGQYEAAAGHLERALASDPSLPAAGVALGEALNNLGRMRDAVPVLERFIAANPTVAAAHFQLGQAWSYLHEYGRAKASHLEALRHEPTNALACYGVALACDRLGEKEMAEEYRRRHVELVAADRRIGQRRVREGRSADEAASALAAAYDLAARIYAANDRAAEAAEWRARAADPLRWAGDPPRGAGDPPRGAAMPPSPSAGAPRP